MVIASKLGARVLAIACACATAVACAMSAGCGSRSVSHPRNEATSGTTIILYRDRALVRQRIDVTLPSTGLATVRVTIARGLDVDSVRIGDQQGLVVRDVRVVGGPSNADATANDDEPDDGDDAEEEEEEEEEEDGVIDIEPEERDEAPDEGEPITDEQLAGEGGITPPRELEIDVAGKRAGPNAIVLDYLTPDLAWDAAYTLTTTPARNRATLRGALAIRNTTGIAFRGVALRVVDAEVGVDVAGTAKELADVADAPPPPKIATRALGRVDLVDGEIRVPLVDGVPREMRSALFYDPVGSRLDRKGAAPERDPALGAIRASTHVTESYEIWRDDRTAGLPGGAVRLLEQRPSGLALVAEARLFDATTRDAPVDTITLGTAEGVTGHRERREITVDDDAKSLSVTEEFTLTIENARPRPIDIVLREHLYRGQNWTLPYFSVPAEKEGPQQIALRTRVPARGKVTVLYVVVYTSPGP